MFEFIWSVIAVAGALLVVGVIFYFLFTGSGDREKDEDARRFYDEHGHWPDEAG